jgi:hypothetical protein
LRRRSVACEPFSCPGELARRTARSRVRSGTGSVSSARSVPRRRPGGRTGATSIPLAPQGRRRRHRPRVDGRRSDRRRGRGRQPGPEGRARGCALGRAGSGCARPRTASNLVGADGSPTSTRPVVADCRGCAPLGPDTGPREPAGSPYRPDSRPPGHRPGVDGRMVGDSRIHDKGPGGRQRNRSRTSCDARRVIHARGARHRRRLERLRTDPHARLPAVGRARMTVRSQIGVTHTCLLAITGDSTPRGR